MWWWLCLSVAGAMFVEMGLAERTVRYGRHMLGEEGKGWT